MEKRFLDTKRSPQENGSLVQHGISGRPYHRVTGFVLIIAILLMALVSCTPQPDQVSQQLVEALNSHNLEGAIRLFGWNAAVDTGSSIHFSGKEDIEYWLKSLYADNLSLSIENLEVGEDQVTADFTLSLDNDNNLGVSSLTGTVVIKVKYGLITELNFTLSNVSQVELLIAKLKAVSPRLTYTVLPDPTPLRANQVGGGIESSLEVFIYNITDQPVEVESITLWLPEGSRAEDLTTDPTGIDTTSPDFWTLDPQGGGEFRIEPVQPGRAEIDIGQGLSFTLSDILVNEKPGAWELKIIEVIKNEDGESTRNSTTIQLAKFPPLDDSD